MRRPVRMSILTVYDPELGSFEIMRTDAGWWSDLNQLRRLFEGVLREKTLINAWAYAGITKRQWRHFIRVHPAFNQWRRARKSRGIPVSQIPSFIMPDPCARLQVANTEDRVSMWESVEVKVKSCVALVPMRLFRKERTYLPSGPVIFLPPSPTQMAHYVLAQELVLVKEHIAVARMPNMDGLALEDAIHRANSRELHRERLTRLWSEQHKDNPLVMRRDAWIITRAGDK